MTKLIFDPAEQDTLSLPIALVEPSNAPIILVTILGSISFFVVALRIFTRTVLIRGFGYDDAATILAFLFFSMYCISFGFLHTITRGQDHLSLRNFKQATLYLMVCQEVYTLGLIVHKISLGQFFLRISQKSWQKNIIYTIMGASAAIGTTIFFYIIFQCGFWPNFWVYLSRQMTLEKCVPGKYSLGLAYVQGAISIIGDVAYAIMPIFLIRTVQLGKKEKFVVLLILSLGAVGSLAAAARFKYIYSLAASAENIFAEVYGLAEWSCIELGCGITAASLATLRPLIRAFVQTPWSSGCIVARKHTDRSHDLTTQASSHSLNTATRRNHTRIKEIYGCEPLSSGTSLQNLIPKDNKCHSSRAKTTTALKGSPAASALDLYNEFRDLPELPSQSSLSKSWTDDIDLEYGYCIPPIPLYPQEDFMSQEGIERAIKIQRFHGKYDVILGRS